MYAIVIDNDLLQKIDKSRIFDTAEIPDNTVTLNPEHFQNNGVYFYMYNNKDQR